MATLSANRPEAFLITAAAYLMGLRLTWMNPTSSEDDHAYILEDSGVTTLFFCPRTFADRTRVLRQRVPGVQRAMSFGDSAGLGEDLLAAAATHTGSLAGDDAVYDAVLREYGVYRARDVGDFFGVAAGASIAGLPRDRSIGLFTVSGGVGVLMADEAERHRLGLLPTGAEQQHRGARMRSGGQGMAFARLTLALAVRIGHAGGAGGAHDGRGFPGALKLRHSAGLSR